LKLQLLLLPPQLLLKLLLLQLQLKLQLLLLPSQLSNKLLQIKKATARWLFFGLKTGRMVI
jgi:hypothetical protein